MKQTQSSWKTSWKTCLLLLTLKLRWLVVAVVVWGSWAALAHTHAHMESVVSDLVRSQGLETQPLWKNVTLLSYSAQIVLLCIYSGSWSIYKTGLLLSCHWVLLLMHFAYRLSLSCLAWIHFLTVCSWSLCSVHSFPLLYETSVSFNHICPSGRSFIGSLIPDSQETCIKALTRYLKTTKWK